jgi:hypothetical protein
MKEYGSGTITGEYANLCWYCHENISNINGSGSQLGYGRWEFYQGKTIFEASGHGSNANFYWPGTTGDPVQIWPRRNRNTLPSGNRASCLNCHTPHGIKSASGSEFDITAVPASKQTVASGNPDVNSDRLIPRQLIAWEEALCENCHKSGGLIGAPDIKTDIDKLAVTGSGHPVHDTDQTGSGVGTTFSGRHSLQNEDNPISGWNDYAANERHVECVDCHNPHSAQSATVFQSSGNTPVFDPGVNRVSGANGVFAGGVNKGVWGVSVNTTTGVISGRVEDTSPSIQSYSDLYLYQICLKCHSVFADSSLLSQPAPSWTNRSRWPTFHLGAVQMNLTDVAVDFAISTGTTPLKGHHPVFGVGRNTPGTALNCRWGQDDTGNPCCGSPCPEGVTRETGTRNIAVGLENNFVPPWADGSLITCVDCHESENESVLTNPRGPHGSSQPFILRKLDNTISYDVFQADGGIYTVNYNNFRYGYSSNTTDGVGGFSGGPVDLGTADPDNMCLNCHRADVYGYLDQGAIPRYRYLSRQAHPADFDVKGSGQSFETGGTAGNPPRGILCMRCHGGGTVGGIHGNSGATSYTYDVSNITPSSNRLLNGTAWLGVTFSSTSVQGSCVKNGGTVLFNDCTHGGGGGMLESMYDY